VALLISRNSGNDIFDIVLDTGCTFAITLDRRDFIEYTEGSMGTVQTVNGPTPMSGYGKVRWTLVISKDGQPIQLIVLCHHVPASNVRLLSPQDFCQYAGFDCSKDQFGGNSSYFWMNSDHDGTRSQCPIEPQSNLPVTLAKTLCHDRGCSFGELSEEEQQCMACHRHSIATMSVFDETNQNITAAQKELLLWHTSSKGAFC
jgi:hypothetical protein